MSKGGSRQTEIREENVKELILARIDYKVQTGKNRAFHSLALKPSIVPNIYGKFLILILVLKAFHNLNPNYLSNISSYYSCHKEKCM